MQYGTQKRFYSPDNKDFNLKKTLLWCILLRCTVNKTIGGKTKETVKT